MFGAARPSVASVIESTYCAWLARKASAHTPGGRLTGSFTIASRSSAPAFAANARAIGIADSANAEPSTGTRIFLIMRCSLLERDAGARSSPDRAGLGDRTRSFPASLCGVQAVPRVVP